MKILPTPIDGLVVVEASPFADHRGAFCRLFCERELESVIGDRHFVQVNHSRTNAVGAVRGMHYQKAPHAEMKIVRCLRGRVWDVAVDLRAGSPTFLKWFAVELSPQSGRALVIPEGFAHGFQVLEEASELLYLHTAFYEPSAEGGVRYDDPLVGIDWPLVPVDMSQRDNSHPKLDLNFHGLTI